MKSCPDLKTILILIGGVGNALPLSDFLAFCCGAVYGGGGGAVAVLIRRCRFYAVAVAVLFAVAVVMVRAIHTGKQYLYIYTLLTVNSNIFVTY